MLEFDISKTIGLAVLSLSLILRLTQATRQQLTIADSDPHTGEYSIPHWRSFDVYVSVKKTTKDTPDTDSQTHRLTDTQTHREMVKMALLFTSPHFFTVVSNPFLFQKLQLQSGVSGNDF